MDQRLPPWLCGLCNKIWNSTVRWVAHRDEYEVVKDTLGKLTSKKIWVIRNDPCGVLTRDNGVLQVIEKLLKGDCSHFTATIIGLIYRQIMDKLFKGGFKDTFTKKLLLKNRNQTWLLNFKVHNNVIRKNSSFPLIPTIRNSVSSKMTGGKGLGSLGMAPKVLDWPKRTRPSTWRNIHLRL